MVCWLNLLNTTSQEVKHSTSLQMPMNCLFTVNFGKSTDVMSLINSVIKFVKKMELTLF